jgi:hypothetical protein
MTETITMPDQGTITAMSPGDASAKLAELQGNESFRGRYLSGAGPEVSTLNALMARRSQGEDRLDQIVSGTAEVPMMEFVTEGNLSTYNALQSAAWLREKGIPDPVIKQAFKGEGVDQAEYDAATKLKADLLGDRDFVKNWLSGDREAVRRMTTLQIIITGGAKKAAA